MKKLLLAILAFIPLLASAQQKEVGSITWTAQVSLNYINGVNFNSDFKDWFGSSLNFKGKYQVADHFGVSAGINVLYSASPEESEENLATKVKVTESFNASYIELPILASYDINKHIGIQAGLKPAYELKFEHEIKGGNTTTVQSAEGETNKFQLYVPVGVTYQFNSPLSLAFHYNIPLTKINKDKSYKDMKFNQFALTLGYDF